MYENAAVNDQKLLESYKDIWGNVIAIVCGVLYAGACFTIFHLQIDAPINMGKIWTAVWPKWFALFIASTISILLFYGRQWVTGREYYTFNLNVETLVLLLFGSYFAVSTSWASDPGMASIILFVALGTIGTFIFLSCLKKEYLLTLVSSFIPASAVIILLYSVEDLILPKITWYSFGNENFSTEFAITMAFAAVMLSMHYFRKSLYHVVPIYIFAALTFFAFSFGINKSHAYLMGVAAIVPAFMLRRDMSVKFVALSLTVTGLAAAAFLAYNDIAGLQHSFISRGQIWLSSVFLFEYPIFGYGVGSYSAEYPRVADKYFDLMPSLGMPVFGNYHNAGAVHNEYIQAFVEMGIVGLGLTIAVIVQVLKVFRTSEVQTNQFWLAVALIILLGIAAISFPFQRPETVFVFIVLYALMVKDQKPDPRYGFGAIYDAASQATKPVIMFAVVLCAGMIFPMYKTSFAWAYYTLGISAQGINLPKHVAEIHLSAVHQAPLTAPRLDIYQYRVFSIPINELAGADHEKLDYYWRLSEEASPYMPFTLRARLLHVMATGAAAGNTGLTEDLLNRLKLAEGRWRTWPYSLEAQWASVLGDGPRMRRALEIAKTKPLRDSYDDARLIKLEEVLRSRNW